jgi:hypothetical protein
MILYNPIFGGNQKNIKCYTGKCFYYVRSEVLTALLENDTAHNGTYIAML